MATKKQINKLHDVLVKVAKGTKRVSYSQVDHLVGLNVISNPHDRTTLEGILGSLGVAEIRAGRPFLPAVVVVRKRSRRPEPGFYLMARSLSPKYASITPFRQASRLRQRLLATAPGKEEAAPQAGAACRQAVYR